MMITKLDSPFHGAAHVPANAAGISVAFARTAS